MTDVLLDRQGWFGRGLNLLGLGVTTWAYIDQFARGRLANWFFVLVIVGSIIWLAFIFLARRSPTVALVALSVMALCGSIAAPASNGVSIVLVIVGILWLSRDLRFRISWSILLELLVLVLVLVGDLLHPIDTVGLLSMEAGLVVAFFAGYSRRQFLIAEAQSRELLGEQARTDALAARQRLAGDIHDVLAHSLGGLVIQLDAVDALLEAGETDAAAARVRDSRALAAEGLSEARRAVAALKDSTPPPADRVSGDQVASAVTSLLDAHRSLGGQVSFAETGKRREVSSALEGAIRRAVQEGLTNARKHAPGQPVAVSLDWTSDGVRASVANPLPGAGSTASPDGHGLVGMRERFSSLPGGVVFAGAEADRFVVRVQGSTA